MSIYIFAKNGMGDYTTGTGMREDMLMQAFNIFVYQAGIVLDYDLKVSQNTSPDMSVNVAAGRCFVKSSSYVDNTPNDTKYWGFLNGNDEIVNLAIATNTSGLDRFDIAVAKVDKAAAADNYATNVGTIEIIQGTDGAGVPATPSDSLKLAEISVPDGTTVQIVDADIEDTRTYAGKRDASGAESQVPMLNGNIHHYNGSGTLVEVTVEEGGDIQGAFDAYTTGNGLIKLAPVTHTVSEKITGDQDNITVDAWGATIQNDGTIGSGITDGRIFEMDGVDNFRVLGLTVDYNFDILNEDIIFNFLNTCTNAYMRGVTVIATDEEDSYVIGGGANCTGFDVEYKIIPRSGDTNGLNPFQFYGDLSKFKVIMPSTATTPFRQPEINGDNNVIEIISDIPIGTFDELVNDTTGTNVIVGTPNQPIRNFNGTSNQNNDRTERGTIWFQGNGIGLKTLTFSFDVPFASDNVTVQLTTVGYIAGSDPTDEGSFNQASGAVGELYSKTASGFEFVATTTATFSSSARYGFDYIAIGPK